MQQQSDKARLPVVECPGCKVPMRLLTLEHAVGDLSTATYRCDSCGTETHREFKATPP